MMIIGRVYEFVDKNRKFPFGFERGAFLGYTPSGWPRFMLRVRTGTQCFINAADSVFEEIYFNQKMEKIEEPTQ